MLILFKNDMTANCFELLNIIVLYLQLCSFNNLEQKLWVEIYFAYSLLHGRLSKSLCKKK